MKFIKHQSLLYIGLLLAFTTLFSSCDDKEDTAPAGSTIAQLITADNDLSLFQAALAKTRLTTFTEGGGPFTVFAPTNAAFNAMGIDDASDFNALDSNFLVQVLTYHIQSGSRSYTEIPLGPNATMSTQGGFTQYAARYIGGTAYINGAAVVEPNIPASNGYMHVIDKVLIPGFGSAALTLASSGNYKLMLQAMTKTVVSNTTNPLTIFAIPNSVMTAAGYDSTTIANLVTATAGFNTLKAIIQYHLVPQRIFSPNFKTGTLKTVQGTNVVINNNAGVVTVKGTNNPAPFNLVIKDVLTTTGVIHSIDGMLKP